MKQLIFHSFLCCFLSYGQEIEHISLNKIKSSNALPSIANVYFGNISIEKLASVNGIEIQNGLKVVSFTIEYPSGAGFKSLTINSNQIPEDVIFDIRKSCLNEQIFFTNIKAMNHESKYFIIPSMNLTPILNEN
jgi:hypothetical protein